MRERQTSAAGMAKLKQVSFKIFIPFVFSETSYLLNFDLTIPPPHRRLRKTVENVVAGFNFFRLTVT